MTMEKRKGEPGSRDAKMQRGEKRLNNMIKSESKTRQFWGGGGGQLESKRGRRREHLSEKIMATMPSLVIGVNLSEVPRVFFGWGWPKGKNRTKLLRGENQNHKFWEGTEGDKNYTI